MFILGDINLRFAQEGQVRLPACLQADWGVPCRSTGILGTASMICVSCVHVECQLCQLSREKV